MAPSLVDGVRSCVLLALPKEVVKGLCHELHRKISIVMACAFIDRPKVIATRSNMCMVEEPKLQIVDVDGVVLAWAFVE